MSFRAAITDPDGAGELRGSLSATATMAPTGW